MVASFSAKDSQGTGFLQTGAMIHRVARHAVADDKVLEASDVVFRIDARGNVVMIEPESRAALRQDEATDRFNKEKLIVVPRQEAYERIAYATRKKGEQLRGLCEITQRQARRWSQCSWLMAAMVTGGILLAAIAAIVPDISQRHTNWLLLLMSIDIGGMAIIGYLFWRAQQHSRQASLYLDSFLEIEHFYEMVTLVSELPVKEATRRLLQEVIIAQSLGLHSENIEVQDEDAISYSSSR